MRNLLFVLGVAALLGCGKGSPAPGDGGGGGNGGGGGGGGSAGDMAPSSSGCSVARDCRLFSSYCVTTPCQCFAVGAHDVDPPCVGGMQACIVDPCLNKAADCRNGACVVTP